PGRSWRAFERMEPQLAVEGGTPNPKKLNADSIRMADATPKVPATNMGATVFGRMCRKIVRESVAPSAFAAITYSRDLVLRNSPRVSLATVGQLVIPMTTIMLRILGGRKATTVMMRKNVGIVSIISMRREAMMSTSPP